MPESGIMITDGEKPKRGFMAWLFGSGTKPPKDNHGATGIEYDK